MPYLVDFAAWCCFCCLVLYVVTKLYEHSLFGMAFIFKIFFLNWCEIDYSIGKFSKLSFFSCHGKIIKNKHYFYFPLLIRVWCFICGWKWDFWVVESDLSSFYLFVLLKDWQIELWFLDYSPVAIYMIRNKRTSYNKNLKLVLDW